MYNEDDETGDIKMEEERLNPDALLETITKETHRGKLKIFFGYAAGVGKTYAMLEAAHAALKAGIDVVIGYIEPHTRPETMALVEGLEEIPNVELPYKNMTLKDFDIDRAMIRHPQLILVDELAHTNSAGMRHKKRYQDIEELLRAGIDVYTTVNVQHLESLNDIVASITGIVVRERIPDDLFDSADQVELVDIEPDELIERLNEGKIYQQKQASKALGNFFLKENLVALREIALRRSADRVNRLVEKNKQRTHKGDYFTEEHILICLSSSPSNAKVIRAASRMARAFNGSFTALYVEKSESLSTEDNERLLNNIKLAEQSGARIVTMHGEDIADQISEFAKAAGVSKVVIGRSNNKRRYFFNKQSLVEKLTVLAPNLDVYIIPDYPNTLPHKRNNWKKAIHLSFVDLWKTVVLLVIATLIGAWFYSLGFSDANIITVYILSTVIIAMVTKGRIYSVTSSLLSVLIFNYFFTYPHFTLMAYDKGYPVTFLVMFIASFLISTLTTQVKEQARQSARQAHRTSVLLETSQKLQRMMTYDEILKQTAFQVIKLLNCPVVVYACENKTLKAPIIYSGDSGAKGEDYLAMDEQAVAQWVFKNNKHAGASTNTLPGAKCLYLAIRSQEQVFAVLGIAIKTKDQISSLEKNLLVALLGECALALEKEAATRTKNEIEMQAKQEQLRANLLRSISHDLRSPLTSISGNAGILLNNGEILDEAKKQSLYSDIYDDSIWLINLVENLLAVTRIDNGTMAIHVEPELVEEVCVEALSHISRKSREHEISLDVENEWLMAKMDTRLIVQVLINIVDNAIKYTQIGSKIEIHVRKEKTMVLFEIADNGMGITDEDKSKLFEMFYTANSISGDSRRGLGLGLALCQSIIQAHGGEIGVRDNDPQGTIFYFTLPAQEVNLYV